MTSSESGIPEALEAVEAQGRAADTVFLSILLMAYIVFATLAIIEYVREKPADKEPGYLALLLIMSALGAVGVYLLSVSLVSGLFTGSERENRDATIQEHVESNIDGTVKYVDHYSTRKDDPKWVREAEHVATIGIEVDGTIYPQDIVMAYHDTHDVMFPVDPTALERLPLIEGSSLAELTKHDSMFEQLTESTEEDHGTPDEQ